MEFIAVLDYEHLDNGVFLSSFAKALSGKEKRGIIIHGDSEHTERIIQTGVMRSDAQKRSIKELNHRLVALFADEGVSTIGLNGFQKSLLTIDEKTVAVDKTQIEALPGQPMILLSNLGIDLRTKKLRPVPLSDMAEELAEMFKIERITLFSVAENPDIIKQDFPEKFKIHELESSFIEEHIPEQLRNLSTQIQLKTASTF